MTQQHLMEEVPNLDSGLPIEKNWLRILQPILVSTSLFSSDLDLSFFPKIVLYL